MTELRIPYWLSVEEFWISSRGFKIELQTLFVVYEFKSTTDLIVWCMWRTIDVGLIVGGLLFLWNMFT